VIISHDLGCYYNPWKTIIMSRLFITGGSGFIGREIARRAVADGHEVRSLSRSGRPSVTESWADGVEWITADVFEPHEWRTSLEGCDAVVHTIGIVSKAPKKGVATERMDGDSAIVTALEAERAEIPVFALLSVVGTPSSVSDEYVAAKRRAEQTIADLDMRTAVLRPGLIYAADTDNPHFPDFVNTAMRMVDDREWLGSRFGRNRPLSVESVARVALDAVFDPDNQRVLEVSDISQHEIPLRPE
jgi:uncharacterized protein YbjT (DUF2867 family)